MAWLTDRVAIVTGAASGIGEAVARRFVEEGARVVAMDLSAEGIATLQNQWPDHVLAVEGDVRRWGDQVRAVTGAVSKWGRLDIYIANAGVHDGGRRIEDLAPEQIHDGFEQIMAVNVMGCLLGARAAAPELRKARGNVVISLSTSSFYVGGGGGSLYVASKHAALGVMRALAYELAPEIRVNGVGPSYTPTGIKPVDALATQNTAVAQVPGARPGNLLNVPLRAEDHTGAYVYLASDQARAVTGVVIGTDAGRGIAKSK